MKRGTVRDPRTNGASVLDRVARGESLVITRDGTPVAELVPLPRRSLATAEVTAGPAVATSTPERAARQAHVQQAEADVVVLPFDAASTGSFGWVTASLRAARPPTRGPGVHALIAATALAHDLPLFTCNPSDVAGIERLVGHEVPIVTA